MHWKLGRIHALHCLDVTLRCDILAQRHTLKPPSHTENPEAARERYFYGVHRMLTYAQRRTAVSCISRTSESYRNQHTEDARKGRLHLGGLHLKGTHPWTACYAVWKEY